MSENGDDEPQIRAVDTARKRWDTAEPIIVDGPLNLQALRAEASRVLAGITDIETFYRRPMSSNLTAKFARRKTDQLLSLFQLPLQSKPGEKEELETAAMLLLFRGVIDNPTFEESFPVHDESDAKREAENKKHLLSRAIDVISRLHNDPALTKELLQKEQAAIGRCTDEDLERLLHALPTMPIQTANVAHRFAFAREYIQRAFEGTMRKIYRDEASNPTRTSGEIQSARAAFEEDTTPVLLRFLADTDLSSRNKLTKLGIIAITSVLFERDILSPPRN